MQFSNSFSPISISAGIITNIATAILLHRTQDLEYTAVGRLLKKARLIEPNFDDRLQNTLIEALKLYFKKHPKYELTGIETFFQDPVIIQQIGNYILDGKQPDQDEIQQAIDRHLGNDAVTKVLMHRRKLLPERIIPDFFQCYRQVLRKQLNAPQMAILLEVIEQTSTLIAEIRASEERMRYILSTSFRSKRSNKPENYIPFMRSSYYQPRPDEFKQLEALLFNKNNQDPKRIGLVGMLGMAGVGKTQLAVELIYRYKDHFPDGTFWLTATGKNLHDWMHKMAQLAVQTDYLPPNDDVSDPENVPRRAQHLCRYLANHREALLVLDNVEEPSLILSALPALAGSELSCTVLYTSRNTQKIPGLVTFDVKLLPEKESLQLLLKDTRPLLLSEILDGSQNDEAKAARAICKRIGYLPLGLIHLRNHLIRDKQVKLTKLAQTLEERGAIELAKDPYLDAAPLFATFWLSWKKVNNEAARQLFKLAAFFPEAVPIPLWLLGLASGLGEVNDIFEPLGKARLLLQEMSLVEDLSDNQVRLHPLVREFGRRIVAQNGKRGKILLNEVGKRLTLEFIDLNKLEQRAKRDGYWKCLEQARAVLEYISLLDIGLTEQFKQMEQRLDQEGYILGNQELWPETFPGLFYQQLSNRSIEEDSPLKGDKVPERWLRLKRRVGTEDGRLLRIFVDNWASVTCVAFSFDGSKILTGSRDQLARIWETATGKELVVLFGHTGTVTSAVFSPDGSRVLTGSHDGTVRIWETTSGKPLLRLYGQSLVNSVAFSPDSSKILIGRGNETALWEIATGKKLIWSHRQTGNVMSVAFSPDGSRVLTGSKLDSGEPDQTVRLWDTSTGKELMRLENFNILFGVLSVAFSPDGSKVLAGFMGNGVKLWDSNNGKSSIRLQSSLDWVNSVAFSPDGTKVLAGTHDGKAQLWDTATGKELVVLHGHSGNVTSVAFSPDGTKVLTGADDGTARLWDISKEQNSSLSESHTEEVMSVAFSPDGSKILTGSSDGTARLWATISNEWLATLHVHGSAVTNVAFSPDGSRVLTGSDIGTAELWELVSGKLLASLGSRPDWITSATFSPDGARVLIGRAGGSVEIWTPIRGKQVITLRGHTNWINSVAFSPDSSKVLTSSVDETTRLWEASTGKELAQLQGHSGYVWSSVFSPDGTQVLTGSLDQTTRLWEASTGKELVRFEGHSGQVTQVAFSLNGNFVIICNASGRVIVRQARGKKRGKFLGAYFAKYGVSAIHWQDPTNLLLADRGGTQFRPHIYQLKLEGTW